MTDLNQEREEFESDLADHLIERDANGFYLNDEIQNYWEKHLLKLQIKELKAELEKAKAQAVPDTHIVVPRSRAVVVAIEKMVEQQVEASGITSDVFRLDGWRILDAIQEASESGAEG